MDEINEQNSTISVEPVLEENKVKFEHFPWVTVVEKLFNKEKTVGLENINFFDFNFLLQNHIENYTVFIESKFLYNTLKQAGKKLIVKKILKADSLTCPIYYYAALFKNDKENGYQKLLTSDWRIKSVIEPLDSQAYKTKQSYELLRQDLELFFLPHIIVDMLKLIYHVDEKNRNINAILLFSNNLRLIPTINELINNDIAVYLGISKQLKTPVKLLTACSGVIDTFSYLENLGAITDIKE